MNHVLAEMHKDYMVMLAADVVRMVNEWLFCDPAGPGAVIGATAGAQGHHREAERQLLAAIGQDGNLKRLFEEYQEEIKTRTCEKFGRYLIDSGWLFG